MEDIELDIQYDALAEALLLLKEASSSKRRWATIQKGDVEEDHLAFAKDFSRSECKYKCLA